MANDTAAANAVLSEIEVGATEGPEQLRQRAAVLDAEFATAITAPMRLSMEAATLRARATAIEKAREAEAPVAGAQAAVAEAEAAFAATAQPAEEAAQRSARARHLFEEARDAAVQAQANGADPAELIELDVRATSAARVDVHEEGALADAEAAREAAKRALDAARARLDRAREDLDRARAAIDAPLTADRPLGERFAALFYTWPTRAALRHQDGYQLDPVDLALCRQLCQAVADDLDVVPPRLARQIADEAAREATRQLRGMRVSVPGTSLDTTVGALVGAPAT